jgi:hypothetical protein
MSDQIKLPDVNAHPSQFQDVNFNSKENIKNERTLLSVTESREKKYNTSDLGKLESPGNFNFTEKVDNELSGSNTRHLFKGLYGETPLTFLFFSKENINNIQNVIKYLIFKEIGQIIDNQNNNELMIIMRSIFLEYSRHPLLLDESMDANTKSILLKQYSKEVERLNDLVITESVPRVISQVQQYIDYLRDSSQSRSIMEKPKSDSVAGTRSYRSTTSVLTGSNL